MKPPKVVYKVEAEYTEQARVAHYSGVVQLTVIVGRDGSPLAINVDKPAGYGLDKTAINAVSRWRFKPGTRNGEPAAVLAHVEVSFRYM